MKKTTLLALTILSFNAFASAEEDIYIDYNMNDLEKNLEIVKEENDFIEIPDLKKDIDDYTISDVKEDINEHSELEKDIDDYTISNVKEDINEHSELEKDIDDYTISDVKERMQNENNNNETTIYDEGFDEALNKLNTNQKTIEDIENSEIGQTKEEDLQIDTNLLTDEDRAKISELNTTTKHDNECGIWLCLPTGFGEGCDKPYNIFLERITLRKSPLPNFSSCKQDSKLSISNVSEFTSKQGVAAYIPAHQITDQCIQGYYNGQFGKYICTEWSYKTIPATYIKNKTCYIDNHTGYSSPKGCTKTVSYAEVYINGQLLGEPYYY